MLDNYEKFADGMILRDYLALDRSVLANERTLLSYIRTFIGLAASGAGLIHFIETPLTAAAGYAFIIISPFFLIFGIRKYIKMKKKFNSIQKKLTI